MESCWAYQKCDRSFISALRLRKLSSLPQGNSGNFLFASLEIKLLSYFCYLCCMGDKSAAVSVLMPAYNHGKFIRQAIESFLAQEQADAHLYIGNDASTDNTLAIAQEYASRYPHKITLFSHSRNLGLMGNYKFLIENSASR